MERAQREAAEGDEVLKRARADAAAAAEDDAAKRRCARASPPPQQGDAAEAAAGGAEQQAVRAAPSGGVASIVAGMRACSGTAVAAAHRPPVAAETGLSMLGGYDSDSGG